MKKALKYVTFLIMVSAICIMVTGCEKKIEYPYMNSKDEISTIEIVVYSADNKESRVSEIIANIECVNEFLEEFEEIDYYEAGIIYNPQGVEDGSIAVRITYQNGDYEIFNWLGRGVYKNGIGYDAYDDWGYFNEEQFNLLVSKWCTA